MISYVYKFYRGMFKVTLGTATLGYLLFLINVFAFPSPLVIDMAITMMFYGLYFGVLSRDLIDYVSDRMASNIGV